MNLTIAPSRRPFSHGHEWPCEDCAEVVATDGYFDPSSGAAEPPESHCGAETCVADVDALRELEAEVKLAAAYVAGALRIATLPRHDDLLIDIAQRLSETLADHYHDARVAARRIAQRIERETLEVPA